MAVRWKSSRFPGVRYYEHSERKHGVRPDRYFAIRFQIGGRRREEGLGWGSQGWTESKAADELAKIREAARKGEGPTSLAEKREAAEVKRQAEAQAKAQAERSALSFTEAFEEHYLPHTSQTKSVRSVASEKGVFANWIKPVIGGLPLKDIAPIHVERIRKNMRDKGRAPRTVHRVVQIVRQVFNHCVRMGLYSGNIPTSKLSPAPKKDGSRQRFLSREEAHRLLDDLAGRSIDLHDQALLSLHCGLRAGEIFGLTWADVDTKNGLLTLRDTKAGPTRHAYMTAAVKQTLLSRKRGNPSELVFPPRSGERREQISKSFGRAVKALGLNDGISDPRQKVVFHSLRHTFASWLAMAGVPLITVARLLGHSTTQMTERYSHLAPDHMREAVKALEGTIGLESQKERALVSGE